MSDGAAGTLHDDRPAHDEAQADEAIAADQASGSRGARRSAAKGATGKTGARSTKAAKGAATRDTMTESAEATLEGRAESRSGRKTTARSQLPRASRSTTPDYRIAEQPAFVLHSYPYRETSLIIDVLSRDHGRVALVAKGAKRPHSALRGVLQTFQPLALAWTGKGEVRTLTGAEWVGGMLPLTGDALLCGFYVNELLVKFIAREDPHPELFRHYVVTLTRLAHDEPPVQVLRAFERVLLREAGYALALNRTVNRKAVVAEGRYVFDPERGVREASDEWPSQWPRLSGQTLLDMEEDDYHRPQTVAQSKALMRFLLNTYLGGTPLATRQILIDLQNL
ncbi:DNA repair protein RecO [Paraburkholderia silvatlantica]|uniref:DNA repair protein RecO n=1 Tax=Paraburkholderia silvatlantica TaxID=321895 RepID=A0ABR6FT57_9BURK|nr:DNA repair protein RecO [Paraburkholderia silvatlantica]MBB2929970.1 DNA repair protein RecO (recombination protein O) [Paraburkholderia silvatlantica]PVY29655.1 DNA replication and repair protein RecO [Paraburkholderia silvatlantica]PXW31497.1 DNA replication and repair protein RecO [Paraburkholderia silvatlantica]